VFEKGVGLVEGLEEGLVEGLRDGLVEGERDGEKVGIFEHFPVQPAETIQRTGGLQSAVVQQVWSWMQP